MKNKNCCFSQLYQIIICLIAIIALAVSVSNAQCPADFPVDCGNGYCCPTSYPICGTNADLGQCFSDGAGSTTTIPQGGCPTDYPVDCGNGYCCPSNYPVCGTGADIGKCGPYGSGGGTTTTTPGGGGTGTYLTAINITGSGAQDAPQPSGTLPGTSPSEAVPLMAYEGIGQRLAFNIMDKYFPPLEKGLYDRTLESLKKEKVSTEPQISTYAIGDVKQFWVKDKKDLFWRQVTATNKKEGAHSLIFVDNNLNMADAILETYTSEFETMFAIISNNIGTFSDRDGNGKIIILIYDINDGATVQTGWIAGYFWSKDYINDSETQSQYQGMRSNEADLIYIRGNEPAGWTPEYGDFAHDTLTTLIHEYQHMVHFCITYWQPGLAGKTGNFDDVWINEMMSMASETMYFKKKLTDNPAYTHDGMLPGGYLEARIMYYNKDPKNSIRNGHGLVYWDSEGDDVFSNYSLAYIFGQYLNLQSGVGEGIYKEILNYMTTNSVYDYRAVEGVAKQQLSGISSWEDLIRSWAIANMLNQPSGLYGYKGAFSLTPHGPTSANVTMHSGGVVYRIVNGSWTTPADAGANIKYYGFSSGDVPSTSTTVPPGQNTTTTSGNATTTTTPGYTCPPEYPVDCNNGYCCPDSRPVCGTGNNEGKCLAKGICISSLMFGNDSYENELLRSFRDQVLARNSRGEELSRSYYEHTAELALIILRDRELYREVMDVTLQLLPAVELTLQGSVVSIDSNAENKIAVLCAKIAQKASPDLRKAVEKISADVRTGRLLRELGLTP